MCELFGKGRDRSHAEYIDLETTPFALNPERADHDPQDGDPASRQDARDAAKQEKAVATNEATAAVTFEEKIGSSLEVLNSLVKFVLQPEAPPPAAGLTPAGAPVIDPVRFQQLTKMVELCGDDPARAACKATCMDQLDAYFSGEMPPPPP